MIARLRTYLAKRKLERIVAKRRNSLETRQFRERRAAMLRHTRGVA